MTAGAASQRYMDNLHNRYGWGGTCTYDRQIKINYGPVFDIIFDTNARTAY